MNSLETLKQLDSKKIAFPAKSAFGASMITRQLLNHHGIKYQPVWAKTHDNGYLGVLNGSFSAAGGIYRTFKLFLERHQDHPSIKDLVVIAETEGYTPHAFAAHPNLDKEFVKKVQQELLAEEMKPFFATLRIKNGLVAAEINDWQSISKNYQSFLDTLK